MDNIHKLEEDLASIRHIMDRSVRFLSLSGLSGILAGIFALVGSAIAYYLVYFPHSPFGFRVHYVNEGQVISQLLLTAAIVLIASISSGYILTAGKARRKGLKIWDKSSKRLLLNMAIPLAAGGIFILALLSRGYFMIVAPACLLFYGLALINGSHFTYRDVRYLGYCQVILGLLSAFFPGFGLIFWALGFGVMHIVYGMIMHYKYE
jgi:hypothetical protein